MKPWTNTHTVAVLWLIAACLALGWIAGLVTLRQQESEWGQVTPAPKRIPASVCTSTLRAAYCP